MEALPSNRVPVLEIEFTRSMDSETRLVIKRPVNGRMDDAMDCSHQHDQSGNAQRVLGVASGCVVGLHFRDIYVPADAEILEMRLVLPIQPPVLAGALTVQIEAARDARPFDTVGHLPSQRTVGVSEAAWRLSPDSAATNIMSPNLATLLRDLLDSESGWQSGNSLTVLLRSATAATLVDPAPLVNLIAFDKFGYSVGPAANSPTEWRHFRRHRFAQLSIMYSTSAASHMVFEVELASENDNADATAADQNINFGWQGNGSDPERGGFIFRSISLPVTAQGFQLVDCRLVLPTDGPYLPDLGLQVRVEDVSPPATAVSTRAIQSSVSRDITDTLTLLVVAA